MKTWVKSTTFQKCLNQNHNSTRVCVHLCLQYSQRPNWDAMRWFDLSWAFKGERRCRKQINVKWNEWKQEFEVKENEFQIE